MQIDAYILLSIWNKIHPEVTDLNPCEAQKKRTGNSRGMIFFAKVGKQDQQQELALS